MWRVAVVLPAYNEERRIRQVVGRALAVGAGHIVCVDDCSSDSTRAILEGLAADPRVEALHHRVNLGKQAAVKHGLARALRRRQVSKFAVLDADMQNDPALLPRLCHPVGRYDAVFGRRSRRGMPVQRRLANALANVPYQMLAALRVHDVQSGYRVYTRPVARWLASGLSAAGRYTLEHTSMLLLARLAVRLGRPLRIAEVPIPHASAGAASSIRLRDNLQLTWAALYHAGALALTQR